MLMKYLRLLTLAAAIALIPSVAMAQGKADFVVITLGTGTPGPVMDRMGPATLVMAGDQKLLFDSGRGVLINLNRAHIPAAALNGVFLTHLHSDHVVGLPDLWLTGWLPAPFGRRTHPMKLWGPVGTQSLAENLEKAYAWDIKVRIDDQRLPPAGAKIEVTEISDGVVYEKSGVKVTAFTVNHGPKIKPAFGYRVDYDGRSVTLSGDTTYDPNLIKAAKGTTLLIHQTAMAKPELVASSMVWKLILNHHTTPAEAGKVFSEVAPKLAVLYHIVRLTNGKIPAPSYDDVVTEVKSTYSGPLVVAEDMMRFVIGTDGVNVSEPK